jgi:hypothetical protein
MSDDLQHRDWLLISTKQILQKIDQNLSFTFKDTEGGGKTLTVGNISEKTLDKFFF